VLTPLHVLQTPGPPFLTPQSRPPSSLPRQRAALPRSPPTPLLLPATQTVLRSNPSSSHGPPKFCWTGELRLSKGSNSSGRTAQGGQGKAVVARHHLSPPHLAGLHPERGKRPHNAQAANRGCGGQPKESCSPETDRRQLFKTQPQGLTCCFPCSTLAQELPKYCALI